MPNIYMIWHQAIDVSNIVHYMNNFRILEQEIDMYACHVFDNIPQSLVALVIILIVHRAINVGLTMN